MCAQDLTARGVFEKSLMVTAIRTEVGEGGKQARLRSRSGRLMLLLYDTCSGIAGLAS